MVVPQKIDRAKENKLDNIENFVISKNKDGVVISTYEDDIWDLTCLFNTVHSQFSRIYFNNLSHRQKGEAKWLTYILLKKATSKRGAAIKPSTILIYYKNCIRPLTEFSTLNNCSVFETIENKHYLIKFARQSQKAGQLSCIGAVLNHINGLGKEITKVSINDIRLVHQLSVLAKSKNQYQQHPVIPSRIYLSIIKNLWLIVRNYWKKRQYVHQLIIDISNDREQAKFCWDTVSGAKKHFPLLAKKYALKKFCSDHNIHSVKSMVVYIRMLQNSCKHLIHTYTGMRDGEVLNLKSTCFNKIKTTTGYITVIEGETTKLVANSLKVRWVAPPELKEVIKVLTNISTLINTVSNEQHEGWLFLSTGYLGLATGETSGKNHVERLNQRSCPTTLFPKEITISEEDLKELERLDPFRNWLQDPKFKVGKKWHLTSHQFRRSLAVYAAQSGLVSLPSLKRQFKHLTKEMTLYYAKNSSMAQDILGVNSNTPDHFLHYYHKIKPEVDAIAYIYNILLNEEPLQGAHGQWVERHNKGKNILANRQNTIDRFIKGEISYKETALGGCTTIQPCDKKVMRSLSACLDCSKAVIVPSKLSEVIEQNKLLIASLQEGSVEYRIEQQQLSHLISFQQRMQIKA